MKQPTSKIFFSFLLIFSINVVSAESLSPESLLEKAESIRYADAKAAVKLLTSNQAAFENSSPETFFEFHYLLINIAMKTGQLDLLEQSANAVENRLGQIEIYHIWGALFKALLYHSQQNYTEASAPLKEVAEKINNDLPERLLMWFEYLEGQAEARKNANENALKHFNQALSLAAKLNAINIEILTKSQLISMYYYMQQYDKALTTNQKIMEKAQTIGDPYFGVLAKSNAMNIYYMMSVSEEQKAEEAVTESEKSSAQQLHDEYTGKSLELRNQVLAQSHKIGAFRIEMRALVALQNEYLAQDKYTDVVKTGEQVIKLADEHGIIYEKAVAYNNIAIAYRASGEHDKGLSALREAEKLYQKINDDQFKLWVLEDYSIAYEIHQEYDKALEYYKKYHDASTKLIRKTNSQKVLELQEVFDHEKNLIEIQRLNKENQLSEAEIKTQKIQKIMFVGFGVLVSIILLSVYNRGKIIASKNKKLDDLNKKLKDQALKDPLTGLYNRRLLSEIQYKISNACIRRFTGDPDEKLKIGLVLFDIDHFKNINDSFGHDVGDEVIQLISNELTEQLRKGDLAIRWGGEEFLAVLFDTNEDGVEHFCERILNLRNEKLFKSASHEFAVTSSIGYALFPFSNHDPNWLSWNESLKIIDNFLYLAKHAGRNCAVTVKNSNDVTNDELKEVLVSSMDKKDFQLSANLQIKQIKPKTSIYQ